ncbi:MAG: ribosomal-protein-alanine N-acetyltransferase [Nitrospirae bacterium]|nr:MAG: ribosomal-protein-alanine N-acetyltransferase [Nitrospirota bacterium]
MVTSSSVQVRILPASKGDLDEVVALDQLACPVPWTRTMFEKDWSENPFGHCLIAREVREQDRPSFLVGYICFWVVFEEIRIMNLAVHPSVRRQGIGRQLVTACLAYGKAQGATKACLEVRASNVGAQALYQQLGFREYGRRVAYYTSPQEDAILMLREESLSSSRETSEVSIEQSARSVCQPYNQRKEGPDAHG